MKEEKYVMKSSTRDKVEGKMHQAKGTIKEAIGKVVGDCCLKAEGKDEHSEGKIQEKLGQIKKVAGK
jgi:uncharacterized protein YjbJ (UPF0337 family)